MIIYLQKNTFLGHTFLEKSLFPKCIRQTSEPIRDLVDFPENTTNRTRYIAANVAMEKEESIRTRVCFERSEICLMWMVYVSCSMCHMLKKNAVNVAMALFLISQNKNMQ